VILISDRGRRFMSKRSMISRAWIRGGASIPEERATQETTRRGSVPAARRRASETACCAQPASGFVRDERHVPPARMAVAERLLEQPLSRATFEQVGTAHDLGDALALVIDDHGKLVSGHAETA
jgi:hypothetical protein